MRTGDVVNFRRVSLESKTGSRFIVAVPIETKSGRKHFMGRLMTRAIALLKCAWQMLKRVSIRWTKGAASRGSLILKLRSCSARRERGHLVQISPQLQLAIRPIYALLFQAK